MDVGLSEVPTTALAVRSFFGEFALCVARASGPLYSVSPGDGHQGVTNATAPLPRNTRKAHAQMPDAGVSVSVDTFTVQRSSFSSGRH